MNLTIHQALRLARALRNLLSTRLPVKLSYTIAKFARKLDDQLRDFNTVRQRVISEASVDGKMEPEVEKQVVEELTILADEALTVELQPIPVADLPADLEISIDDMMVLLDVGFIEEK